MAEKVKARSGQLRAYWTGFKERTRHMYLVMGRADADEYDGYCILWLDQGEHGYLAIDVIEDDELVAEGCDVTR